MTAPELLVSRGKILIIDHNTDRLAATVPLLRHAGYEVFEATRGVAALRQAGDVLPQLILMVMDLPDMSGVEVCRRIKNEPALSAIFVVHWNPAQTNHGAVEGGFEAGADGYIARPLHDREFLAQVRGFFRHKETLDRLLLVERLQYTEGIRELQGLGQYATGNLAITARNLGISSLREVAPEVFSDLVRSYGGMLDAALEQQVTRQEDKVGPGLRTLAEQLFVLKAGPRDVIDIHHDVLTERTGKSSPARSRGFLEVGRFTVLQLMGNLAGAYRNHYVAVRAQGAPPKGSLI